MTHDGASFLGAVPLAHGSMRLNQGRERGPIGLAGGIVPQPGRSPFSLGQDWWSGGSGGGGTTGSTTGCYECTGAPPSMMPPPPAFADCVEVDASECGEQYGGGAGGGGSSGGSTPPAGTTLRTSVTALEARRMQPFPGAIVDVFATSPTHANQLIGSGVTGSDGKYTFDGLVPNYRTRYSTAAAAIHFVVRSGSGQPYFAPVSVAGGSRLNNAPKFVAVCPGAMPAIVCDIATAQAQWRTIYEHQLVAWSNNAGYAYEQASAIMRETFSPTDARLRSHWVTTYHWWAADLGIPPEDWDNLVNWHQQTAAVFNSIPFPRWAGIEDLFTRCAVGIPITQGIGGENLAYGSARLYSETFSAYFPRSTNQIAKDMAASYSMGLASVLSCMNHKMLQKLKEVERSMKAMSMINLVVLVYFAPMLMAAGPAGYTVIATELYDFTKLQGGDTGIEDSYGITAALAVAAIAANNTDILMISLQPILDDILKDLDPLAAKAVNAAVPKILETAIGSASEYFGTEAAAQAGGATGAASGASLGASVGPAALVIAIKLILSIAKTYAAEEVLDFQDATVGANNAANDVLKYFNGEEAGPEFRPFLQWVVDTLDFEGMINEAINQFLEEYYEVWEQADEQGGTIALVPEEDGTLTLVATDGEGTPTDDDGDPLPGGVAPTTPLEDYEPKLASDGVALIGVTGATVLLLVAGGVL